jgi:spermidine/putrescine transport system ATP-binding protein
MTVEQNVAYGLKVARVARDERRRRVAEMLELVGLDSAVGKLPSELSGGMRQRVALARALVKEPSVLLLDEPLAALDRKLRESMQVELRRIQRQLGMTFLYVTHDQDEALSMADRVVVMRDGRIEQVGRPDEVYDEPSTLWVGGFVGASNELPGMVRSVGATVSLETDMVVVQGVPISPGLRSGVRAVALVRPEHVRVSQLETASAENTVRVFIEEIQHIGSHLRYIARTAGGLPLFAREQRSTAAHQTLMPGAQASFSWPVEAARIYTSDEETTNTQDAG